MNPDIPDDVLKDVQRWMANFSDGDFDNQKRVFFTAVNFDYLPALEMCQSMWSDSVFLTHAKNMFSNAVVSGSMSVFNALLPVVDDTTKSAALQDAIETGNEECYDALQKYMLGVGHWSRLIHLAAFAENKELVQKLLEHPLAEHRHTEEARQNIFSSLSRACVYDDAAVCDVLAPLVNSVDCQKFFDDAIAYDSLNVIPVLARHIDLHTWGQTVKPSIHDNQSDGMKLAIQLWREAHTHQCQKTLQSVMTQDNMPQAPRAPLKKM